MTLGAAPICARATGVRPNSPEKRTISAAAWRDGTTYSGRFGPPTRPMIVPMAAAAVRRYSRSPLVRQRQEAFDQLQYRVERDHGPAIFGSLDALAAAFPCK